MLNSIKKISVIWNSIKYNFCPYISSNGFNGSIFAAPIEGLYSFYVTARQRYHPAGNIFLVHKDKDGAMIVAHGSRNAAYNNSGYKCDNIVVQATLHLQSHDLVYVQF